MDKEVDSIVSYTHFHDAVLDEKLANRQEVS